ncbi:unnamed protein product [Cyclocybe aegerita]|uniref:F-box domain-containing protein n=1 Tax=Cyclocybe aegerita TaxID=1973307 RepID=A0A8S0W883_CYCAE|nr:unnamed protein product [Cyclocybe aegerita]
MVRTDLQICSKPEDSLLIDADTPIQRLHGEILWAIFNLNTDWDLLSSEEAIRTTLASSQVCRSWRALALGSPSLWASVVDISTLTPEGVHEVLQCAGGLPLSVTAGVYRDEPEMREGMMALDRIWPQIQSLKLEVREALVSAPSAVWDTLYRPSITLKYFTFRLITYSGNQYTPFLRRLPGLFSGKAPLLTSFSSPFWEDVNLSVAWVSQLQHLSLGTQVTSKTGSAITVSMLLDALKNMTCLKSLSFVPPLAITEEELQTTLPTARLLSLCSLSVFTSDYVTLSSLLTHIIPAVGCATRASIWTWESNWRTTISEACRTSVEKVLLTYAKRWLAINADRDTLSLNLRRYHVFLDQHSKRWPRHDTLSVDISNTVDTEGSQDFFFVLSIYLPHRLNQVTVLNLELESKVFSNPHVQTFLLSLPNVATLNTTIQSLAALRRDCVITTSSAIPFPKLAHVRLRNLSIPVWIKAPDPRAEKLCKSFLTWRSRIGHPVAVFDFTKCQDLVSMAALDEINGLKVCWTSSTGMPMEYICGSGNASILQSWAPKRM